MEILFANVMGFCFGVRRAVELAQKSLNENCGKKVYSLGPLIHNEKVLEALKQKGLNIIEENDIEHIEKESVVIIRAHGVAPNIIKSLDKRHK